LIPHTPYYGTADATPLYLITLHAAWRATGDRSLIERHLQTAEACLTWIDKYGDRDGDGFQEYQTRSKVGYENMAWKDSGDSVMYPDGTLVFLVIAIGHRTIASDSVLLVLIAPPHRPRFNR
jgi:glycogen debranching enzyme